MKRRHTCSHSSSPVKRAASWTELSLADSLPGAPWSLATLPLSLLGQNLLLHRRFPSCLLALAYIPPPSPQRQSYIPPLQVLLRHRH